MNELEGLPPILGLGQFFVTADENLCIANLKDTYKNLNYKSQLGPIINLGQIYFNRFELLYASAIYNYALNICIKTISGDLTDDELKYKNLIYFLKKKLLEIENLLIESIHGRTNDIFSYENVNEGHQKYLTNIRLKAANRLKVIEEAYSYNQKLISEIPDKLNVKLDIKRAEEIKTLYENIAKDIKIFIKILIEECLPALGEAPCEYSIVGLGSLARSAMTPFSDLEFCILIEDVTERLKKLDVEHYEQEGKVINEINKEYFRKLTMLLHLKVINLGETILPAMAIRSLNDFYTDNEQTNWFFDNITPRGFAFDALIPSACKTPLGEKNLDGSIKYELIQTPQGMADFHDIKNEQMLNGKLSTLLINSVFIYGNEKLFDTYHEISAQILKSEVRREVTKLFYTGNELNDAEKEDLIRNKKLDITTSMKKIVQEKLAKDLHDFTPDIKSYITFWIKGFDIKKEFYRFITQIIEDLALINEVVEPNIWNKLRILFENDFFTEKAYNNLKIVLSLVLYLRLKIYLTYNKQSERFLINDTSERSHLISFNVEYLSKIYCTYIPVYHATIEFCNNVDIVSIYPKATDEQTFLLRLFLSKYKATEITNTSFKLGHRINIDSMYENTEYVQGIIWIRLKKFNEAKKCFIVVLGLEEHNLKKALNNSHRREILDKIIYILDKLGFIEEELGDKLASYNYHKQALQRSEELKPDKDSLANGYNSLAVAARQCNNLEEACKYHMKALQIRLDIKSPDAAMSYNNLAKIFEEQKNISGAIYCLEKAKSLLVKINQTKNDYYNIICQNLNIALSLQKQAPYVHGANNNSIFATEQLLASIQTQEQSSIISFSCDNENLNLRKNPFFKK